MPPVQGGAPVHCPELKSEEEVARLMRLTPTPAFSKACKMSPRWVSLRRKRLLKTWDGYHKALGLLSIPCNLLFRKDSVFSNIMDL